MSVGKLLTEQQVKEHIRELDIPNSLKHLWFQTFLDYRRENTIKTDKCIK